MSKADLKIDWATHKAADYACKNWHYSGCMPSTQQGKSVKIGVWEKNLFIGVVVFSRGATPNLGKPYGLNQMECVELVRIALTKHENAVSRIISLSIKFLKKTSPNLRLIVSFADTSRGHHGGIYQATNWIYSGQGSPANFFMIKGKLTHPRTITGMGLVSNIHGARKIDPNATVINVPGKHRYLMPIDDEMRKQILPLSKPYPKRVTKANSSDQLESGGAVPTHTLQT